MQGASALGWTATCPKCGGQNQHLNNFCGTCGAPMHSGGYLDCPGCGFRNPWPATFCGGCGGALSA